MFGLSFDTAGPKREVVEHDVPVAHEPADEPLTADRGPYAEPPTVTVGERTEDTTAKPLG